MSDFKKGETVYLKTKKFNNTPHTGKVVKVTDSHVHISSAGGTYKAPKNIVTREYKDSHLYKSVREEVAVNAAGAGNVAGLGVGPQGEPGVKKKKKNIMTFSRFMRK